MNFLGKRFVLVLSAAVCLAGGQSAVAGNPIGDFFKRLGNSIAHPRSSPTPRKPTATREKGKKPAGNERAVPPETPPPAPSVAPVPTPTPHVVPMPVVPVVRTADKVPPTKRPRLDLPYGIPVPNKPGFVTSPYAPKSGYVDVRGFPSGTEVKDPYTGRIFLTP
jgi:hypothetical protein